VKSEKFVFGEGGAEDEEELHGDQELAKVWILLEAVELGCGL
jgi:hypothetical protein